MFVFWGGWEMTRSDWANRQEQTAEDKRKPNLNKKWERGRDWDVSNRENRKQETGRGIKHSTVLCNYFCSHHTDTVIPVLIPRNKASIIVRVFMRLIVRYHNWHCWHLKYASDVSLSCLEEWPKPQSASTSFWQGCADRNTEPLRNAGRGSNNSAG